MTVRAFIPKDNYELPDNYGIALHFIDGKTQELEAASHKLSTDGHLLEVMTKDDRICWVPMANVKWVQFDKRFSKIVDIKHRMERAKNGSKD